MLARIAGGIGVAQLSPKAVGSNLVVVTNGVVDKLVGCGKVIDNVLLKVPVESLETLMLVVGTVVVVVPSEDVIPKIEERYLPLYSVYKIRKPTYHNHFIHLLPYIQNYRRIFFLYP